MSFTLINVIFNTFRNTAARVLTLLVSMGYGIMVASVKKHTAKIIVLSIIYSVSNFVYLIAVYINKTNPLTPNQQLFVSLPLSITNTMFFYWIMHALGKTRFILKQK